MDVEFNVNHQTVTRTDNEKVVNWSDDYLRLCFNFETEDWTDCSKFILVFCEDNVYRMALTDDKFVVPEELLTKQKLVFSVYGVTGSYRITTPKILLHLLIAGYDEQTKDLDVDEFTVDVVEAVYLAIDAKANLVHTHDDRYYTETEVNTLLTNLKSSIENRIQLTSNKSIIQNDDTATLTAKLKQDGFTVNGATINFYKVTEDEQLWEKH